ncbi:putative dehydrogenase [Propionicimonas paludicola]|uniref:Putative dehydrogenase n=1 Tax=Propionicimonas paludicola TaxID=185243 RepID=A0A2A9CUX5_9ACTN|nr:Gfo/Idh/MocA family oxidoreductase [Propionicimonas paludicola]PFG18237.1 putative dehydrogenase [Propionicimonas paludicola]
MSEPLRIGILGAARIAERAVVAPAKALGAEVVAIAARSPEKAQAYAAQFGIAQAYGSYAELLSDPAVEVVYNALPNSEHVRWNLAALRAGKHVLSEKPFGSNAAEARLVAAEPKDGLVVFEGFHHRYHPVYKRLLELTGNGTIGQVTALKVQMKFDCTDLSDIRWLWPLAGGSLMDLGCYTIHVARDVAQVLGGSVRPVRASATAHAGLDPRVDATATVIAELPGGATATLESSLEGPQEMSILVTGTEGTLFQPNFIDLTSDDRLIIETGVGQRVERLGTVSTYTHQLGAVIAAIRDGAGFPTDLDNAIANMDVIDECYRLAGLPVRESTL